ncbi:MAG: DUF4162 domain-containing protein, partial [Actinomycetota bacterium]
AGVGGDVVTLSLPEDADGTTLERARAVVARFGGAGDVKTFDHSVAVPLPDATANLSALVRRMDDEGIPISKLSISTPSLDEVFLKYTGERMRVEDTAAHPQNSMAMAMRGVGRSAGRR